jgi:preprotein translocase subunit SecB
MSDVNAANKNDTNKNDIMAQNRKVLINAQYVKDLSFENPGAPQTLVSKGEAPEIDISVDIQVNGLQDKIYEVNLIIAANAKVKDKPLFVAEVSYGGVFSVDVPENEKEAVLMIYCPGMLFPFARRIIADATRDGGFPPLMLDPIDFASLFQQHKAQSNKKSAN